MIYFSFSLSNPFVQRDFDLLYNPNGKITKNKSWEICVHRRKGLLISFGINWTTKQCHAGFSIDFGAFGYWISFEIYDNKHY